MKISIPRHPRGLPDRWNDKVKLSGGTLRETARGSDSGPEVQVRERTVSFFVCLQVKISITFEHEGADLWVDFLHQR